MIQTIRVKTKIGPDLKAQSVLHDIRNIYPANHIKKIETSIVYRLEGITELQATTLAEKLLCEPINQDVSINSYILKNPTYVVEVSYKPGVMNPEVASIIKAAKDLGIHILAANSSREYGFFGTISKDELRNLLKNINLYNATVEHIIEREPETLLAQEIPLRNMNNEELLALSKDKLFLNVEEMKIIQKYFHILKRDPTDCELETLAQTWSEHCHHKTFKAQLTIDGKEKLPLFTRIKDEALKHSKHIVSAFIDNSGVMEFYDGYSICGKVETHNSPSAIEPYGGAATGSGGVFRDIVGTGLGAKNIASTDIFCFARPDMDKNLLPEGCLPPDYLLKRVVTGVKDYGNRMGIPTNNGSVHFHNDFRAKPTVLVGAYGIIPTKMAQKGTVKKGDIVVSVGGRTGRDGIHGATFSSGEMTERTLTVNSSAVQIGNAIEEKRMFDAILEARDEGLIRAIQDCGAGGFSSAVGEMGSEIGVTVDLSKAKLKYEGLAPWEIWISESQERMVIALSPKNLKKFLEICEKYNVEVSELGTFDGSKKLKVSYGKKIVADLEMNFIHHGLPQRHMVAKRPREKNDEEVEPKIPTSEKDWLLRIEKVLRHGNVASKEPIVRLYDHSVQGTNDLQPYSGEKMDGPNNAVVLRPFLDKSYGVIISHGINPILNRIDPYRGSIWTSIEALSNYAAVGGDYKEASLINNFSWPFPDEESLWALDKSVDAIVDVMKTFKIPVISGKDSLSSTYRGKDGVVIKIPPVLCISVFGKINDARKTISSDFKKHDSVIVLLGKADFQNMGGSVYYDSFNLLGTNVPRPDVKNLPSLFSVLNSAISNNQILSCHDISEGGIFTTLFEMCVGGDMGAILDLNVISNGAGNLIREDHMLFNETAGCFLVELADEKNAKELFQGIPYTIIGHTQKEKKIRVNQKNKRLFNADLNAFKKAWKQPMQKIFG